MPITPAPSYHHFNLIDENREEVLEEKTNREPVVIVNSPVRPDQFDGNYNVDDWLESYALAAKANNWNESTCASKLVVYLVGSPRLWWLNYLREQTANKNDPMWSDAVKVLRSAFGPANSWISNFEAMDNRKQGLLESFQNYFFEKLSLLHRYNPSLSETEKVSHISNALLPVLYECV